jgi:hypothetical protein
VVDRPQAEGRCATRHQPRHVSVPRWSFQKQYQPETYFANGFEKSMFNDGEAQKFHRQNSRLQDLSSDSEGSGFTIGLVLVS